MKINNKLEDFLFKKIDKTRVKKFFYFLFFSFICWVFVKLSKNYNATLVFDLEYRDVPLDIVSYEDVQGKKEKLKLHVRASGFSLLGYEIKDKIVFVDLKNILKKHYSPNEKILWHPSKEDILLHSSLKNISVLDILYPYSIEFDNILNVKKKKVPIILEGIIKPENGYTFRMPVFLNPDSVEIEGLEESVDKIEFVKTSKVSFFNIKEDVERNLDLESINNVRINTNSVHLEVFVEPLIEKNINVKITSNKQNIRIIPEYINIIFNVGESKYDDLDTSFFNVVIDFQEKDYNNIAPVKVLPKKMGLDIIKIDPSIARFIIEKK